MKETLALVKDISQHFRRFCRAWAGILHDIATAAGLDLQPTHACLPPRGKNKLQCTDLYVVQ